MVVEISKTYISKFGEHYDSDLVQMAVSAINSMDCDLESIDAFYVSNMLAPRLYNITKLGELIRAQYNLQAPFYDVNFSCASGSYAILQAYSALKRGDIKSALVIGVEKMSDYGSPIITDALMSAANFDDEYLFGCSFASLYGLIASRYLHDFGYEVEILDHIPVKAHHYAFRNSNAHFNKIINFSDVASSPLVADPLKLLHCSPFSDGCSAVLLTSTNTSVLPKIIDMDFAVDSIALSNRKSIYTFNATLKAAKNIFSRNNLTPQNINLFEVHDCFSIAEAIAIEDLGLCEKGSGLNFCRDNAFNVNFSGGLKAFGHPIGATGVRQIAYLANCLNSSDNHLAMSHNVAGTGNATILSLISK